MVLFSVLMFLVCQPGSLSSLADGYRGVSGVETSYTAQGLSRMISASETPIGQKKKGEPPQKTEGIHRCCGQDFKMAHHQQQQSHSSVGQTFVLCYSVLIRLLARLLALVRRYHQVARCSWVPGCRSR